jgi:acyl-CoA thioesterase FadM
LNHAVSLGPKNDGEYQEAGLVAPGETAKLIGMPATTPLTVTHTSTVTPDQIDELGHMNVRWYGANAVAATTSFVEQFGPADASITATYTRHHHEQLEGSQLEVRSALLDLDATDKRARLFHELRNQATDQLAATFVHDIALDGASVERALDVSPHPLPDYGRARSIDLAVDRFATAPTLQELRERNAAIRIEREVTAEDAMGADIVPTWLTNNLMWGGTPPDGDSDWIRETADGDRVAFASMETRLRIGRPTAVGTRIQSFGAAIGIHEKILHELNWVFDVTSGELLAVAETIDLAFSIPNRRARVMAPEQRERMQKRFHPDLDRA